MATESERLLTILEVKGDRQYRRKLQEARRTTEKESKGMVDSFKSIGTAVKAVFVGTVVTSLAKGVQWLARAHDQQRVLEQSSRRLARSIGQDYKRIEQSIVSGLNNAISRADALRFANQAILLGLPVTAKSMEDLSRAALRLGRAMGVGPTQALESLVVGIGRQSKLWLDNLGIIVDVEKAHADYATQLGKTVQELTDAEKKLAFYNATMEQVRAKSAELGEVTAGVAEKQAQLNAALSDYASGKVGGAASTMTGNLLAGLGALLQIFEGPDGLQARIEQTFKDSLPDSLKTAREAAEKELDRLFDKDSELRREDALSVTRPVGRVGLATPGDTARDRRNQFKAVALGQGEIANPFANREFETGFPERAQLVANKAAGYFEEIPETMEMGFADAFKYVSAQFAFLGARGRGLFGGVSGIIGGANSLGGFGGMDSDLSKSVAKLAGQVAGVGAIIGGVQALGSIFGGRTVDVSTASDDTLREIVRNNSGANLHPGIRNEARRAEEELQRRQQTGSQTVNRTIQTLTDESFRLFAAEFSSMHALHKQYLPHLEEIASNTRGGGGGEGSALAVDKSKRAGGF